MVVVFQHFVNSFISSPCLPAGCSHCVQEEEWSSTSPLYPAWWEQRCCRPACHSQTLAPQSEASRWSLSMVLRSITVLYFYFCLSFGSGATFGHTTSDVSVVLPQKHTFHLYCKNISQLKPEHCNQVVASVAEEKVFLLSNPYVFLLLCMVSGILY